MVDALLHGGVFCSTGEIRINIVKCGCATAANYGGGSRDIGEPNLTSGAKEMYKPITLEFDALVRSNPRRGVCISRHAPSTLARRPPFDDVPPRSCRTVSQEIVLRTREGQNSKETTMAKTRKQIVRKVAKAKKRKPAKPAKVTKAAKPKPPTVDEAVAALRDVVTAAELAGNRDKPEVVKAQTVLAKVVPQN